MLNSQKVGHVNETAIKKQITDALKQMGYRVYRIQCGRWRVKGGWMWGAPDGTPDLMVPLFCRGMKTLLWVETKTDKGVLREAQRRFYEQLREGEAYLLARSLDDVLGWLTAHSARP